jgi:hypothetical protein
MRRGDNGQGLPFEYVRSSENLATFTDSNGDYVLTASGNRIDVFAVSLAWEASGSLSGLVASGDYVLDLTAQRKELLFYSGFELTP